LCFPLAYPRGENGAERETGPKATQKLCFAGPGEQPTTYH